jgi:23S rRNA (adenine2503-C2)-methyltransferase
MENLTTPITPESNPIPTALPSATPIVASKVDILSLSYVELQEFFKAKGIAAYKAKAVMECVYEKGGQAAEVALLTSLSKRDREVLLESINFSNQLKVVSEQKSKDGTIKWLFDLGDCNKIEAVFIPEKERGTLCVSSQAGCVLACKFCHTGTMPLGRNLTAQEIVGQVWTANSLIDGFHESGERRKISNIVFMGMGEPLLNWDHVRNSIAVLRSTPGLAYGSRKITVSTSGILPMMPAVGETGVNLAVSLHAVSQEIRAEIMPISRKYPVADLIDAIKRFPLREHRKITWEYLLIDGVNDSLSEARKLAELSFEVPSLVNIIPFNPWPGTSYRPSTAEATRQFLHVLEKEEVNFSVRRPRGKDILAACGQLKDLHTKKSSAAQNV